MVVSPWSAIGAFCSHLELLRLPIMVHLGSVLFVFQQSTVQNVDQISLAIELQDLDQIHVHDQMPLLLMFLETEIQWAKWWKLCIK